MKSEKIAHFQEGLMGPAQKAHIEHLEKCPQCNYDRSCTSCECDDGYNVNHACNCSKNNGGIGWRLARAADLERDREQSEHEDRLLELIRVSLQPCEHSSECIHSKIRDLFKRSIQNLDFRTAISFNRPIRRIAWLASGPVKNSEQKLKDAQMKYGWFYPTFAGSEFEGETNQIIGWISLMTGVKVHVNIEDFLADDWEVMP